MWKQMRAAFVCLAVLTVITGVAYPLAVTAVARGVFARQARGSMVDGAGSTLIGQSFDEPKYFWGRLSATADADGKALPYNAANSGGSNLGPNNPSLVDAVKGRVAALRAADPGNEALVPIDLVTASGSGLDPHVSPAAAEYQVRRVAAARGMDVERVRAVVARYTEGRQLGVLGEPRVNVLLVNRELDAGGGVAVR